MKLMDYVNRIEKEEVYEMYAKLVKKTKAYHNITRKQMAQNIIDVYATFDQEMFDRFINTEEYKILYHALKQPLDMPLLNTAVDTLMDKGICHVYFNKQKQNLEIQIFDEFVPIIKTFVKTEKPSKKMQKESDFYFALVGYVFSQAACPLNVTMKNLASLLDCSELELEHWLLTSKSRPFMITLINDDTMFEDDSYHLVLNNLTEQYTEILDARDQLGDDFPILLLSLKEYIELGKTFLSYWDPNVKKFIKYLDSIKELPLFRRDLLHIFIDLTTFSMKSDGYMEYLVEQFDRHFPNEDSEKFLKIMDKAFMHSVSAMLGANTPIEFMMLMDSKKESKQQHAHLSESDANLFYELYFALLDFVNKKRKVVRKGKLKLYKKTNHNPMEVAAIRDALFEDLGLIDVFVKENPYKFNQEKLDMVAAFRLGKSDIFTLTSFEKEYTVLLGQQHQYAVLGLRTNLDEIYRGSLPRAIKTALLPFKGKIVFDGMFAELPIEMGKGMRDMIAQELKRLPLLTSFNVLYH